jgi:CheY-like chemotaxis protein
MARVHAAVSDLIFSSRIAAEARAAGVEVSWVRSQSACDDWDAQSPQLLIVDLNMTSVDPLAVIRRARSLPTPPKIVAFLSHVQRDLAQQAADSGADAVLPRSAFVAQLPELLRGNK